MIRLAVKELAERRGIMNAYQLQKLLGIKPGMASRLWKGDMKMIGLNTINSLCNELDCGPDDLFHYVPDKKTKR